MALLFLGKLLVAVSICYQAYLLFDDKKTATSFDTHAAATLKTLAFIPTDFSGLLLQHLRLAVVGLLAFSGLAVLVRSAIVKVPVVLGLLVLLFVNHWPITAVPSFRDYEFWQLVATIGGYVYLLGADHGAPSHKQHKPVPVAESKPAPAPAASQKPNKPKRN